MQSRSTHNLVGLSSDESDGAWHNFQWKSHTAGAVFWRMQMHPVMPIDTHGSYPYGSLLDAVDGGYLTDSGAAIRALPQHGPGFVVWNFNYMKGATPKQRGTASRSAKIRFWGACPWIADPILAGPVPPPFYDRAKKSLFGLDPAEG